MSMVSAQSRVQEREVGRVGKAHHVGAAEAVDGNAFAGIAGVAAQVGRVSERRVDDQRAGVVVGTEGEGDFEGMRDEG